MGDENGSDKDKTTFTAAQQKLVDELVGKARIKARELAKADIEAQQTKAKADAAQADLVAKQEWRKLLAVSQARVKELEPLEAQIRAYEELIEGMLKDTLETLGEAAKKAIGALPKSMAAIEKLNWLHQNEGLFQATGGGGIGSPKRSVKKEPTTKVKPGEISSFSLRL